MNINDLILSKEEVPIIHHYFEIPIHPKLLDPSVKINENLANKLFPSAAKEWYLDLKKYCETLDDKERKDWIKKRYLSKKPKVQKEGLVQKLTDPRWEDLIDTFENGFARFFSISRNYGGSIYFREADTNCQQYYFENSKWFRFSREKAKNFFIDLEKKPEERCRFFVYAKHNVDNYPGALFLRNWALLYLNAAVKEVFSSKDI